MRTLAELWSEYQTALGWEPEQRRIWLEGLSPAEGANLFAEVHNLNRTTPVELEIYKDVEALNWRDYYEKMEKVARHMGIQLPK